MSNFPLLAFCWPIEETELIRMDDSKTGLDDVYAFYPLAFASPLSPSRVQVDVQHAADIKKLKASWWLNDRRGLFGFIDINKIGDGHKALSLLNAVRFGKYSAISPESQIIESTTEPGPITVVTEARLNNLALVAKSAKPEARLWAEYFDREEVTTGEYRSKFDYVGEDMLQNWIDGYVAFTGGRGLVEKGKARQEVLAALPPIYKP